MPGVIAFIKNLLFLFTGRPGVPPEAGSNETIRLILGRRSCRSFSHADVSPEHLKIILEAGRFAPSTVNLQSWSFITLSRDQWQELFERPIPFGGRCAIVICADTARLKDFFPDFQQTPFVNLSCAIFNAGLAAMNMTIAAEALGLRSIMLSETGRTGILDMAYVAEKLKLPEGVVPLTTLVVGKGPALNMPGIPPRQPWGCTVMEKSYDQNRKTEMQGWFDQMFLGFKMTHPASSFDKQIAMYRKKMLEAEAVLKETFKAAGGTTPGG